MSNAGPDKRSFEKIELDDLKRLAVIALRNLRDLFDRNPALASIYRDQLVALALCQGGAEHYLRGVRGVNDFDIWAFFCANPMRKFPPRRRGTADYGASKFGRQPDEPDYVGRRVDVFGRDIPTSEGDDAVTALRRYLTSNRGSAAILAEQPVILIHPDADVGRVVWDPVRD